MRNSVGFMCVCPPTHPHYCWKNVEYKDILQKGLKCSKNFCLYMIFHWLSVSKIERFICGCVEAKPMLCFEPRTALW